MLLSVVIRSSKIAFLSGFPSKYSSSSGVRVRLLILVSAGMVSFPPKIQTSTIGASSKILERSHCTTFKSAFLGNHSLPAFILSSCFPILL